MVASAFFCFPNGYYGLADSRVCPEDFVCILVGASVPFILRPHGDGYILMSEAYVHGLMYGEVIEGLEAGESQWKLEVLQFAEFP